MQKTVLFLLFTVLLFNKILAYDVIVAQDGSGNFTTIQAAVNAAPTSLTVPYTIFIKNGRYREKINVPSSKPFLQMIGESVANVFVYYDDYASLAGGTSNSASVTINANDFSAFNITFANTFDYDAGIAAGVTGAQAVAVLVNGDRVAFKNCRFQGNQDTLYQNKKGYYKNCYIDGIIDFIFGGGATIFDSCTIYPKTRTGNGTSYITAANTPIGQSYGYVFRDCKIIGNPGGTNYYLGRPWQNSTGQNTAENKVAFLNTVLNSNILPAGWAIWDAGTITSMITDAEYQNKFFNGNPVDVSSRVAWSFQLTAAQYANYTNGNILPAWDPCTVYPGICSADPSYIAVSNFLATKGVGSATFKWNLSWGIDQVKMELFRSLVRNGAYTKIGELTSPNDTTYNYNFTDNALPPGQQVYYYIAASKTGLATHITDTLLVSTKPTISAIGALGAFLQGGGVPSASQNYTVNGVNLSDNVVIVPPLNFEISLNNATWITTAGNITLPPVSGVLSNTIIYVRLNTATAPGSFSGNILHTTVNGDNVLVPVTGTSQIAALTPPAFYRSKATGNLSDVNTWETSADSVSWFAASAVPNGAAEENITLMPGSTVTIDVPHLVNGKWTVYGSGAGLGGVLAIGAGPLTFANNSMLVWNRDGGTLPTGTIFNAGSTFNITGTGNGVPVGSNSTLPVINGAQVFHHVILNTPNCKTNNPNFNGNLNTINGNLTVLSTGAYNYKIRLSNSPTQVINIGGDLILNPPLGSHATFVLYSTATAAATQSVNINGNLYVGNNYVTNITGTNGTFLINSTAVTLNAANPNIVPGMGVTGTGIAANTSVAAVSGTSLTLSTNTSAAGTNVALTFVQATSSLNLTDNNGTGSKVNIKGNITLNNAIITNSGTGLGTININRTDGVPQFFTRTGGTYTSTSTLNVLPNAIFDVNTSVLPCIFNLNAGAILRSAASNGFLTNITSASKTLSSAASYVFNGTTAQTTSTNFAATTPTANTVNNMIINNPAGVTLSNSLSTALIGLNTGKLTLGANNISTSAITGGSTSSYIITDGAGKLKINNVGAANVLYPVGPSASAFNPMIINNSGTADNFSVKVKTGVDNSPFDPTKLVNVQWDLTEDIAGGSNLSMTPSWNAATPGTGDEAASFDHGNNLVIGHYDPALLTWSETGAAVAGSNPYTVTASGFTGFSPFAVGNANAFLSGTLPLQLLNFNAVKDKQKVLLNWQTENASNLQNFYVERSADGINFVTVTILPANNTIVRNNYNITDNDPLSGISYYRLKIVERNATVSFSTIVKINGTLANTVTITPNPATEYIKIKLPDAGLYSISIVSADGKNLLHQNSSMPVVTLPISNFKKGIYLIRIQGKGEMLTQKFIKQ
jgi:pectinesterase